MAREPCVVGRTKGRWREGEMEGMQGGRGTRCVSREGAGKGLRVAGRVGKSRSQQEKRERDKSIVRMRGEQS